MVSLSYLAAEPDRAKPLPRDEFTNLDGFPFSFQLQDGRGDTDRFAIAVLLRARDGQHAFGAAAAYAGSCWLARGGCRHWRANFIRLAGA